MVKVGKHIRAGLSSWVTASHVRLCRLKIELMEI